MNCTVRYLCATTLQTFVITSDSPHRSILDRSVQIERPRFSDLERSRVTFRCKYDISGRTRVSCFVFSVVSHRDNKILPRTRQFPKAQIFSPAVKAQEARVAFASLRRPPSVYSVSLYIRMYVFNSVKLRYAAHAARRDGESAPSRHRIYTARNKFNVFRK